jgi:SAM-dependent methyltransferase
MVDKQKNFKSNYIDVVYNVKDKPFTNYPGQLIYYLINRFNIKQGSKILEIGSGRGEFINEFQKLGNNAYAVDSSIATSEYFPKINFSKLDLENEKLPFDDETFDIVFSKSVIEHFYYPEDIMKETFRVLKKGGIVLTLTPEWNYIFLSFYEDYTHRTPFTKVSLEDLKKIVGFKNIQVESFKQLPILWSKNILSIFFSFISYLTRILVPEKFRMKNKWIRFSKEIMILCKAEK